MKNLKELKDNSIRIDGTVTVCWPQYNEQECIITVVNTAKKFSGYYAVNAGVVCFVDEHEVHVTPWTREVITILSDAGFREKDFFVPFSNREYPKHDKYKWEYLRALADESYYLDYERESIEWCNANGIGELSEKTMERCFRIPRNGVPVKHPKYVNIYHPICNEFCMDRSVTDKLGRFCTNNGMVVFIYRDGHTYVVNGYWIIKELHHAGYKKSGLFVPFSNGEKITDPELAAEWRRVSGRK